MLLRYCLKMRMTQGDEAEAVRASVRRELQQLGAAQYLVGIPALEAGGFLPVIPEPGRRKVGRVSAALALPDRQSCDALRSELRNRPGLEATLTPDPELSLFDARPFSAGSVFGDRAAAHGLIGADRLPPTARGQGVNVVIIDGGFDRQTLRDPKRFGGGWARYEAGRRTSKKGGAAGTAERTWRVPGSGSSTHAMMVARNVMAIAPEATIWDVPLLSDPESAPPSLSLAEAIFYYLWRDLRDGERRLPLPSGVLNTKDLTREAPGLDARPLALAEAPWVLVNAWGVLDPSEYDCGESYATNPENRFVRDMPRFSALAKRPADLIFAAGNCGEPTPVPRCGETWTGAGRSIVGANAHPSVLTVGAVRADGVPNGMSAQGPGALAARWPVSDAERRMRASQKPDLCAPSGFREDDDAATLNTGTSAAAGIVAGVIAALRSHEREVYRRYLPPEAMRALLRDSAAPVPQQLQPWDPRLGHGVIDALAALDQVRRMHEG